VTYAALTMARLGLRVAVLVGLDAAAAAAPELDLLRAAGAHLHPVPLHRGPVFDNVETPNGRRQRCIQQSDRLPVTILSRPGTAGMAPRGWFLAPVADELPDAWADAAGPDALVALGWQGLLRTLVAGAFAGRRRPGPSPLVARADLVGVSRDDLEPDFSLNELLALLRPGATLALTHGADGGLLVETDRRGTRRLRRYPAIASNLAVDPTGAGDTFLAALFAARLEPRLLGRRTRGHLDLLLAAAAASLVLEGAGLWGVPTRSAIRERMRHGRVGWRSISSDVGPDA